MLLLLLLLVDDIGLFVIFCCCCWSALRVLYQAVSLRTNQILPDHRIRLQKPIIYVLQNFILYFNYSEKIKMMCQNPFDETLDHLHMK